MTNLKGAGGTSGGVLEFFIGLGLLLSGVYLFLSNITVSNTFSLAYPLFHIPFGSAYRVGVQSGSLLIPMAIGVGMVFFNSKTKLGWVLFIGSIVAMILGVMMSLTFSFRPQSLFDTVLVVGLIAAGAGLFIKSLKPL